MSELPTCSLDVDTGFDDLFSHDDTAVSKIEIANPLDNPIIAKKYLTCHGCKIKGEYVQIKRNITVIECSRLGYASSTPSLLNGTVIDTKLILERIKEAQTFRQAKDILRQLILPERKDRTPQGYYPFSEKSQLVLRTRKFESEPILIQDMKLFRRGCKNPDEGIYMLDASGKIVDISLRYGLSERPDQDRNPVHNLEGCVYIDKGVGSAAAIARHQDIMTTTLKNHERVRDNIQRHINTNLRLCWNECEKIVSPIEREKSKATIQSKIDEYTAKLEDMNKKIEIIKDKLKGIIVDGKYYLPDRPYVTLSYILNHPETVEGTIFIIKSCKNECGEPALFHSSRYEHGHDDDADVAGIPRRVRSHDDDPHAASSHVVYRKVITDQESPRSPRSRSRSRSRSRNRDGGKTKKNKHRNRNIHIHRGKPRNRITKKNKLKNKNKNKNMKKRK
jgi:hypothetical protein